MFLSVIALVSAENLRSRRSGPATADVKRRIDGQALAAASRPYVPTAFALHGKCAMQYSSPSRATRKSRFGSVNSVAPQTAHLCSGSVVAARLIFDNVFDELRLRADAAAR